MVNLVTVESINAVVDTDASKIIALTPAGINDPTYIPSLTTKQSSNQLITGIAGADANGNTFDASGLPTSPLAYSLKKMRWALSTVRRNPTTPANLRFGWLGDSTAVGSGASGSSGYNSNGRSRNRPVKVAEALAKLLPFAVTSNGIIGGQNVTPSTYAAFDARFTFDTNWSSSSLTNFLGGTAWRANAAGSTSRMTFAPGVAWKQAIILFMKASSQGTFNVDINGAAPTQLVIDGVTQAGGSQLVTATAGSDGIGVAVLTQTGSAATHTLGATWVSGTVHILGMLTFDSLTSNLDIVQIGASGADVGTIANGTAAYQALPMIDLLGGTYNFNAWFVCLGINDWRLGAGNTPLDTFATRYAIIVDRILATGADVIIVTPPPSKETVATLEVQEQYVDIMKSVALSRGLNVIDFWSRLQSYEISNAYGYYVGGADELHPGPIGYGDWADTESRFIFNA